MDIEGFSLKSALLDLAVIIALPVILAVSFGMYGLARPTKVMSTSMPSDFGLVYEQVSFYTSDAVKVSGWYVPKRGGAGASTVIVVHGYPADKGDILSRAVELADHYNLLFIDLRYFGQSGGAYTTLGSGEVNDVLAAVDYARSRRAESIGIYGYDIGAAATLMALPKAHGVDAVVAEASYAKLQKMVLQLYHQFGPFGEFLTALSGVFGKLFFNVDIYKSSPAEAVNASTVPILLIHGRYDKVIPFENAEMIAFGLKDNPKAEFWFTDSQFHGEASRELPKKMDDFFSKYLKP